MPEFSVMFRRVQEGRLVITAKDEDAAEEKFERMVEDGSVSNADGFTIDHEDYEYYEL